MKVSTHSDFILDLKYLWRNSLLCEFAFAASSLSSPAYTTLLRSVILACAALPVLLERFLVGRWLLIRHGKLFLCEELRWVAATRFPILSLGLGGFFFFWACFIHFQKQ